ncbi:hypothetical protein VTO42DRAFT_8751 [Malbranchea cinnamomea]
MPQASASGADASSGTSSQARHREHNQGNQDRKYTPEQKAAVLRIRRCSPTAYYEILELEKTATDVQIKKAYRRLSLLTHPDKNGYEGADEAFKMVSRAFQVLSDPDKKNRYDKFGGDPESRTAPGAGASPFGGFSGFGGFPQSSGRTHVFEEEISPEELFNRFFGGGFGPFGGGIFDTGPQFVFNMGGGPGIRVHHFGGPRVRRRPREQSQQSDTASSGIAWSQFLPLILLFVLPLLSSFFSGSTSSGPSVRFDTPSPPFTQQRTTPKLGLNYYVDPREVEDYSARKLRQLDQKVEVDYVTHLRYECQAEIRTRERMIQDAQGWFFPDVEKMKEARNLELRSCKKLESLNLKNY